jgi:hypothetical protein
MAGADLESIQRHPHRARRVPGAGTGDRRSFAMGFLDRLLGREEAPSRRTPEATQDPPAGDDERAVERYRYLLQTAPPERIEEAHAEAFAKLTPEQRRQVLAELSTAVPAEERAGGDDPRALARMATRAEMREPGTLERSLGRGGGMGMGGLLAGSLLASVAGAFIGTAVAQAMLSGDDAQGGDGGDGGDGSDTGGDFGGGDFGGGDFGGDLGGF